MSDATTKKYMKEFFELQQEIDLLQKQIDEFKREQETAKNKLIEEIGEKGEKNLGKFTAKTWITSTENFDKKAFKAENLEVYNNYLKDPTIRQYIRVTQIG